jgi:hypothetical protein
MKPRYVAITIPPGLEERHKELLDEDAPMTELLKDCIRKCVSPLMQFMVGEASEEFAGPNNTPKPLGQMIIMAKNDYRLLGRSVLMMMANADEGAELLGLSKEDYFRQLKKEAGRTELVSIMENLIAQSALSTSDASMINRSAMDTENYEFMGRLKELLAARAEKNR